MHAQLIANEYITCMFLIEYAVAADKTQMAAQGTRARLRCGDQTSDSFLECVNGEWTGHFECQNLADAQTNMILIVSMVGGGVGVLFIFGCLVYLLIRSKRKSRRAAKQKNMVSHLELDISRPGFHYGPPSAISTTGQNRFEEQYASINEKPPNYDRISAETGFTSAVGDFTYDDTRVKFNRATNSIAFA